MPGGLDFAGYRKTGGYKLLERCRSGGHTHDEIIAIMEASGLRGLGGAGAYICGEESAMMDASICGLGQAAPNPLPCHFKFFPEDIPD